MLDKKKAFLAASLLVLAVVLYILFGGDTGAVGETDAALDRIGEQQRRAEVTAGSIRRGLDDSRGIVGDIERANNDFAEAVGNAEKLNNAVKSSVVTAHGKLERAFGLIDDSQRRIAECKEICSKNREKFTAGEVKK